MFEGFLIWGLGQPQSTVPSSIIPAEEHRGGEEGVERRKKTGGDGVISYLSSSPTSPIASDYHSLHLSHLSLTPSPSLSLHLSYLQPYLSVPSTLSCILSASHPSVRLSIYLSVCLSDLSTDGGPFCVCGQMRMTFYCKTDTYGEG